MVGQNENRNESDKQAKLKKKKKYNKTDKKYVLCITYSYWKKCLAISLPVTYTVRR